MHTHTYRHTDSTTRNPVKEKNWMQATNHTEISIRLFITKCERHYERKQKERPEKSNHMARKRKKETPKEVTFLRKAVIDIQPKYSLSFFLQRS
jgi:phage terminase large subunit GpA-like protein